MCAAALASQTRMILAAAIWLSLFLYAGRPLLVGAAVFGVAPHFAWLGLFTLSLLPLLPFALRRKNVPHRTVAHWTGYATMGVFSTLLVLVLAGDLFRGAYHVARWTISSQSWPMLDTRFLSLGILATAGVLSAIGLLQARCPRTRHVDIAIEHRVNKLKLKRTRSSPSQA